jgi:glycosyl transferase family 2
MPDISVIICTHNPRREYLDRVMAALQAQSFPRDRWELLVVDNASAPERAPRVELSWHPHARMEREEQLGLTPARLRGIRESRGKLLVFVDDDNVLAPNYLAVAQGVAEQKPFLGSWSGQCHPGFDRPPPEWTRRYWGNLVIREFEHDAWSNLPRLPATMPCGAGLCVRRSAADHYVHLHETGKRSFQFDRTGSSLLSGGDNDLAASACALGLGLGLVSALELTHLIPPERLTEDYLARLAEGIHFSAVLLDREHGIESLPRTALGRLADFARLLLASGPHRRIARAAYRGRDKALQQREPRGK